MTGTLRVSIGQHSDKGRKSINQDFYGVSIPREPLLSSKGIAVALADGIGSSEVSQVASEFAVMGFLDDYYCTSEAWSVKKSAERVLTATNSWLHSRTRQSPFRYDKDRGYVCTLSALVVKSSTAHVFHVGDSRVYRLHGSSLEQLTEDHRVRISPEQSYLSRAVGFNPQIEIDYHALPVEAGDAFVLATDGVHEHVDAGFMASAVRAARSDLDGAARHDLDGAARHDLDGAARHDLDGAARRIVEEAYRRGSADNLTVQVVVIDELAGRDAGEIYRRIAELPVAPVLEARAVLDGYRIVRELHASHRSHIYLAIDVESDTPVVIKTPSIDLGGDPDYLERFLMEEWVARRIDSPHVLKPCAQTRERSCLYVATEYVDGQTLAQWMIDHPKAELEQVRAIVEQVAKGLQAFHRLEMLHQDLRPENILIDRTGSVKIIDFGATSVAGITEMAGAGARAAILGTHQYTAPEYFLGEPGTDRSDLFSLGVITYQMLSGRLPYGAEVAKSKNLSEQSRLRYRSVLHEERGIPAWIDEVLRKAVHPNPLKRYETLSEYVYDLRHPNQAFLNRTRPALLERNPALFWKTVSVLLAIVLLAHFFVRFALP